MSPVNPIPTMDMPEATQDLVDELCRWGDAPMNVHSVEAITRALETEYRKGVLSVVGWIHRCDQQGYQHGAKQQFKVTEEEEREMRG